MFRIRDGLALGTTVVIDSNGNLVTNAATATAAGRLSASRTISLTGAVTGTVSTDFSGSTSITTTLSNTAVTPGTYHSVMVTQDGRVVSGSNPTTLAGYGITDAQALSAGLTSIAGLTGAGVVTATATNTYAMRAIGTGSSNDILDRASADARYAALTHTQDISTINGLQTTLDGKSAVGHQHAISDTSGLQTALDGKLNLTGGTLTGPLVLAGDPTLPLHPATKQYVDNASAGLDVKESARVGASSNITLSGEQTIDGVAVVTGNRVLAKGQTDPAENGVYVVATGSWTRSADMDTWAELAGSFIFIEEGTVNANSGWVCSAESGGTLGTTAITFNQFSGSGNYTAGAGLSLTGTEFSLAGQALQFNNLVTDGFVVRDGSTITAREIVGSTGLTVSNADGALGNPTLQLATKLSNLASLSSTPGFLAQTGDDSFEKRSLASTTGIVLTNADGVSGNPTIGLSTSLANFSGVTWDSGVVIPVLTAANTWDVRHTGTGSNDLLTGALADARYAALSGSTLTGTQTLAAGTTAIAPLRFQAGSLLTTPLAHAVEWDGSDLFITNSNADRRPIAYADGDISGASAQWSTARTVTFATGQVTGSFSIDGSADVPGVALTIAPTSVTSSMLASGAAAANLGYTPASRAGDTFTGQVTFAAGSSTVAPVRFQSGAIRSSPAAHSMEWNGTNLFITNSSNVRQTIQYASDALAWSRLTDTPTTISGYGITDAVASSTYTAADVLGKLITVDGPGSALDADLLDGQHGSYYRDASNIDAGTLADGRLSTNVVLKDASNLLTGTMSFGSVHRQMVNLFSTSYGLGTQANTTYVRTAGRFSVFKDGSHDATENAPGSGGTVLFTVSNTELSYKGNAVVHAGSMGAGSNIDADLLDGQQGSFYQNSGNQNAGTLPAARLPAFSGDATSAAGSANLTLATVNGAVGTFGSGTQVASFTVNAKGLVTQAANVAITPSWSSVTDKPTTLTGYGITDAQPLDNTLSALATLTGAGVVTASGTDSFAMRSIGASAANDILDRAAADARYLQPAQANATNDARFVQLSGSTMTGPLVLSGDPTQPLHPATKQYVDNAIQGLDAKASVRVATTASITLSGLQTIDGIALVAGDRVLVKNQNTGSQNGIYVASEGSWTRASDFNDWGEIVKSFVFVEEGASALNTGWVNTNSPTGTLDVTPITFIQFSGAGAYTASNGVTRSGSDFQLTGQALALHNLATSGMIARTGSGTVAARTITAPAAGITVSNGNGVSGNPTLALANDLAAVEALATTGFVRRTGTDTWGASALTGTEVTDALGYTPWHIGNDGTGSSLDADLLDGEHGSYYLDLVNASGTLATNRGGTGMSSFTANSYVRATSASTLDNRTFEQVRADIMAARTTESDSPPESPSIGDGWIDSNSGTKYNYVSGYWVEL